MKYTILSGHRNGHGIHSPFVFDLVSRVFRNKIDNGIVCSIEQIRKRLKNDHSSIIINDFGSGGGSGKSNIRKVSDIARYSPVSLKYGVLLSNMAAKFGNPLIIELGTSFGISTMYMASSAKDTMVYTIEGAETVSEVARRNFRESGLENINLFTGSFDEILNDIVKPENKPGLVFIDGNHRKEPVINYFTRIAEISDSNTVIILDDIHSSEEMEEAWNEIKLTKEVTVTVDIFRMGIVFFKKGLTLNNYIIRY